MAIAYVSEFDSGDDRSTTNYDALMARLGGGSKPEGLVIHTAGFDDSGVFRIYEVWESSDARQRWFEDVLEPVLREGPVDPTRTNPPDREYSYELHAVIQP